MTERVTYGLIAVLVTFALSACGRGISRRFPTEAEARARAPIGMAESEAMREFGEPFFVDRASDGTHTVMIYHAPSEMTIRREEGYKGFQLVFESGRLVAISPITGTPSYAP
jgi:hypothetical protein